jgi:SagB-type dehydrogenase family enzyme
MSVVRAEPLSERRVTPMRAPPRGVYVVVTMNTERAAGVFPGGGPFDIRVLHELTKHGDGLRVHDDRLVAFRRLDPANRPAPFKHYRGLTTLPLPDDIPVSDVPATRVLGGWPPTSKGPVDNRALARLLFLTAGVTRIAHLGDGRDEPIWFRAAMSAGNLHPVEVYVVCGELAGVPAGVYHFAPKEFGLTALRTGDFRAVLAAAAAEPGVAASPATLVLTGIPWRTAWKYGERGYRHLYWDAGSMLSNLLAAGDAGGVPIDVLAGFVDAEVSRLLAVDGSSEFPLALAVIGREAGGETTAPPVPVEPLHVEVAPLSAHPIALPLIVEAQHAGMLPSADAVREWRRPGDDAGRSPEPIPPPSAGSHSLDQVVLQRGSTRQFRPTAVRHELLEWGLAVAAGRPIPGDVDGSICPLLGHHISVHAVDGVESGAYRWHPGGHEVLRTGALRHETEHLCLDQPLGGDAAFTVFHTIPLEDIVSRLGPRGYRGAQLFAGIVSGRLALAAVALGCGASGITFFDDAVARFFSTRDSCLLATAVGSPAYRNRPGGRPRAPSELTRLPQPRLRLSG